jgi:hypothetical protein
MTITAVKRCQVDFKEEVVQTKEGLNQKHKKQHN